MFVEIWSAKFGARQSGVRVKEWLIFWFVPFLDDVGDVACCDKAEVLSR